MSEIEKSGNEMGEKVEGRDEGARTKAASAARAAWLRAAPRARRAVEVLRLGAAARWYGRHRIARQWTVNILGVVLLVKFAQVASDWIQPTLTPETLFPSPLIGPEAVRVVETQEGEVQRVATYTGQAQPWRENLVFARVDGYLDELHVYPGDHVRRGQLLARLETSRLQPQLQEATVDSAYWAAEFVRDSLLYADNAISSSEFDRSRTRYEAAAARLKLLRTQVGYAEIRALNEGWISDRRAYPGQYVRAGEPFLKIDQLDRVRIHFKVAEEHLSIMRPGTEVYLRFPQIPARLVAEAWGPRGNRLAEAGEASADGHQAAAAGAASGEPTHLAASAATRAPEPPPTGSRAAEGVPAVSARAAVVFPANDPQTRTGTVEVRLDNPGALLKSNTYVVGDFVVGRGAQGVRVPVSALTPMPGGKTVVFVLPPIVTDGAVEEREVEVGVRNSQWAEILSGLEPGERVVYQGNRGLVNGQAVTVLNP